MNVPDKDLEMLFQKGGALPICPELLGGLFCPRECCEIVKTPNNFPKVVSKSNQDLSATFALGAAKTLEICKLLNITTAILKSKSPSCGYGEIYDGSFSGKLTAGDGLTAYLLVQNNIAVYNEFTWRSLQNI
jgi:uncharacterized protein YbbK (DUF523 family)